MKKFTQKEAIDIMDKVSFPKGLKLSETFKVLYWCFLNKNKFYKFIEGIEKGLSLHFALKNANK